MDKTMRYTNFILLCLILVLVGCQKPYVHPNVYFTPAGISLQTTEGDKIMDEAGIWMPEWYFEELWDLKVKEVQN